MPKTKISEYSATANSNTDVASINIDEGCAPSGINNAIRAVMGHLKDFQQGTNGDPFNGPVNGTVGATTPSTGAFTTLSASSTVTLSGGTANGVAYLNGSKVLTTGSALVFDGTNLGVGTSSPAQKFVVSNGGAAGVEVSPTGGSQGGTYLQSYNRSGAAFVATELIASKIGFYTGTSPTLSALLDSSGNLVLGTTSSLSASSGRIDLTINGTSSAMTSFGTGGTRRGYLLHDATDLTIASETAGSLRFLNNGSERARFDSSGSFVQKGATTAAGIKPTAIANNESITTVNSTTYTITLGTSAKLFWISLGNGDGALVFTSYLSSSITFLGITPTNIAATASPSSSQLGISKSANSHDIVIKTGSALSSTAAAWQMGVLSSQVA